MIVHSRFNRPKTIPLSFGDGILRKYETRVVNGQREFIVSSESSLDDFVMESFEDTLIYNILSRYERGDELALNKVVGQYMDVVGMPSTLAEAQQLLINISNDFDQMPIDVRQKFNNSVSEFVESVSTGKAAEILKAMTGTSTNSTADVENVPAVDMKEVE